jgi:hypothetical protein
MSRGWESKSVEEQQAEAARPKNSAVRLTPEQAAQKREKDSLLLSRNGVLEQIKSTRNSRHKQMLEAALADLNAKLAQIG